VSALAEGHEMEEMRMPIDSQEQMDHHGQQVSLLLHTTMRWTKSQYAADCAKSIKNDHNARTQRAAAALLLCNVFPACRLFG
jgi:hypothetical protein